MIKVKSEHIVEFGMLDTITGGAVTQLIGNLSADDLLSPTVRLESEIVGSAGTISLNVNTSVFEVVPDYNPNEWNYVNTGVIPPTNVPLRCEIKYENGKTRKICGYFNGSYIRSDDGTICYYDNDNDVVRFRAWE